MRGIFSFFKRQPVVVGPSRPLAEDDVLPVPGNVTPCAFSLQGEVVYAMCLVTEREDSSLLLQVLREIGRIPLSGLRIGAAGQLEMDDQLIPLHVMRVSLPWVSVLTSPEQSRQVQRQALRVPASFNVRFRNHDAGPAWQTGAGVNISTGGFCFTFVGPDAPTLGTIYESELAIRVSHLQELVLRMEVEVRWISHTAKNTVVGVRVVDPMRCKDLVYAVSQLQHSLSRQPDDYLLVENQPLHLSSSVQ
jgi:hypothetical protein